ncbi:4-hydroxybenzoyl-CoA thioesterase [Bacillus sp. LL01]|uniref:acyl-CoA thioesterase n=1 Tax=Bacillus sp. LL01 TaxID=1665556 RepID=UPI00064CF51C|nr:4-hydroxybenzoyl-CoA thioesterase [Bacillus sp. LL01]
MTHFNFSHPIRVRYSEIDGQKIVFNAHYLTYIDVAVTEYYRKVIGPNWLELAEKNIFDLVLRRVTLDYLSPAKLDDLLDIHCRVVNMGRSSMNCEFAIKRGDELLIQAEAVQVCFDLETGKSKPIPEEIKERIREFEGLSISVE